MMLEYLFQLSDLEEERKYRECLNSPLDELSIHAIKQPNTYKEEYESFLCKIENHTFGTITKSKENLDAIIENCLSKEEGAIVYMYTKKVYEIVNSQLRNTELNYLDKDVEEYVRLLNSVLDKLNSFDNATIYREIRRPNEPEKLISDFNSNLNKIITFPAFTSCHIDESRWSDINKEIHLIISTKINSNGKDLRKLSFSVTEEEVLFKSNSTFLVVKVDKIKNIVELKEV